ncbi:hypothetical protein GCM10010365_74280 [Streptomyces poonensis]|uniref:Uncharacterized protein n=1 Tax=Streptomyces poonensis TaxID=68255 RepID=A0A918QFN6_9ACTN|nr:hypothetical protein GCM10010365_74280 [Streptomyces poonensis]
MTLAVLAQVRERLTRPNTKAGFTREGVMRAVGFRDGQWRDAVRYAVIPGDTARPDTAEGPESGRA